MFQQPVSKKYAIVKVDHHPQLNLNQVNHKSKIHYNPNPQSLALLLPRSTELWSWVKTQTVGKGPKKCPIPIPGNASSVGANLQKHRQTKLRPWHDHRQTNNFTRVPKLQSRQFVWSFLMFLLASMTFSPKAFYQTNMSGKAKAHSKFPQNATSLLGTATV